LCGWEGAGVDTSLWGGGYRFERAWAGAYWNQKEGDRMMAGEKPLWHMELIVTTREEVRLDGQACPAAGILATWPERGKDRVLYIPVKVLEGMFGACPDVLDVAIPSKPHLDGAYTFVTVQADEGGELAVYAQGPIARS